MNQFIEKNKLTLSGKASEIILQLKLLSISYKTLSELIQDKLKPCMGTER